MVVFLILTIKILLAAISFGAPPIPKIDRCPGKRFTAYEIIERTAEDAKREKCATKPTSEEKAECKTEINRQRNDLKREADERSCEAL